MNNSGKVIKRFTKTILWLCIVIVLIIALLIGSFYIYRTRIYNELVTELNKTIPGEIVVEKIHMAPFKFYPNLTFRVKNVEVFEHKLDVLDTAAVKVIDIKKAWVGLHYKYLWQKKAKIAEIVVENGDLNVIINEDSTMNLLYAFGDYKLHKKGKKVLEFLDLIEITNVDLVHHNKMTNKTTKLHIHDLKNKYHDIGEIIDASVVTHFHLNSYLIEDKKILKNQEIGLDLDLKWEAKTKLGSLDRGQIDIGTASINLLGNFDMNKPSSYDLTINAEKKGLSTIDLDDPDTFLSEDGLGQVFLKGRIKGKTSNKIPNADITFTVKDLAIDDPKTKSHIRDLNFSGHLNTGDSIDLSTAELNIEHLNAIVSGDSIAGSLYIKDFTMPYVIADLKANINLENLEEDLNIKEINNLKGHIVVKVNLDGIVDYKNDKILKDAGNIKVTFEDVSFGVPETKHVIENVTADIIVKEEKIIINKLSFSSGKNDIKLRGDITNLIYELSGQERPIEMNMSINSSHLDLNELLAFDTALAKKFNEVINKMSMNVEFKTTTTNLDDLKSLPNGEIVINSLMTDFKILPDIKDISGIITIKDELSKEQKTGKSVKTETITFKDLKIRVDRSDLTINGNIYNAEYPGNKEKSPAGANLVLQSNKLFLKEILQFDSVLAKTYEDEISNLDIHLRYDTYLEDVEKNWYLPVGTITLEKLSADFEQRWDLNKLQGEVQISEDTVRVTKFVGIMGQSDLEFTGYINNYPGLFDTDSSISVDIGFTASSSLMRAKDFFTKHGEFYLPSSFEDEFLKDFNLVADYKFVNQDFFSNIMLPDMWLKISDLKWKTSNTLLDYRDINIEIIREGTGLKIESFKGIIGSSDFEISADVNNFEPFKVRNFKDLTAHFIINANTLDLNELLEIKLPPKSNKPKKSKKTKFNPFDFIYHDVSLDLDVGALFYDEMVFRDIKGEIDTKITQEIILDSLNFATAGGNVKLTGQIDANDPEKPILTSQLDITNIFIDKILFDFHFKNDSIDPSEHFKGILSSTIDSKVAMDAKFNVDLESAAGTLNLTLDEGQIINYAPMQELKKYFGQKDLNNIRLGEISNTVSLNNGVINIPRMEVNSTLGYLYFTGIHNFDSNLEYHFEVPFKLLTSAAWTMLVKRHRKDGAPEDEIQRPKNKEALVSLRLIGNDSTGYSVKLGKGKGGEK